MIRGQRPHALPICERLDEIGSTPLQSRDRNHGRLTLLLARGVYRHEVAFGCQCGSRTTAGSRPPLLTNVRSCIAKVAISPANARSTRYKSGGRKSPVVRQTESRRRYHTHFRAEAGPEVSPPWFRTPYLQGSATSADNRNASGPGGLSPPWFAVTNSQGHCRDRSEDCRRCAGDRTCAAQSRLLVRFPNHGGLTPAALGSARCQSLEGQRVALQMRFRTPPGACVSGSTVSHGRAVPLGLSRACSVGLASPGRMTSWTASKKRKWAWPGTPVSLPVMVAATGQRAGHCLGYAPPVKSVKKPHWRGSCRFTPRWRKAGALWSARRA